MIRAVMSSDASAGAVIAVLIVVFWIALFLFFRQFVLWYFRINERTELLKDIRDSLRQMDPMRSSYIPDPRGSPVGMSDGVRRRPGESEDQFNSRVADELQRQLHR